MAMRPGPRRTAKPPKTRPDPARPSRAAAAPAPPGGPWPSPRPNREEEGEAAPHLENTATKPSTAGRARLCPAATVGGLALLLPVIVLIVNY